MGPSRLSCASGSLPFSSAKADSYSFSSRFSVDLTSPSAASLSAAMSVGVSLDMEQGEEAEEGGSE